jgi:hypothetical protein
MSIKEVTDTECVKCSAYHCDFYCKQCYDDALKEYKNKVKDVIDNRHSFHIIINESEKLKKLLGID